MVQEHYTTMKENGWTQQVVDGLTLRQYVFGWAMVQVWENKRVADMALAVRNAQPGVKDATFSKWIEKMRH